MLYPYSSFQPAPPDPPESEELCRVYAKFLDVAAQPVKYAAVHFRVAADVGGPVMSAALDFPGGDLRAHAGRDGFFFLDLLRGASLLVTLPGALDAVPFRVPDLAIAPLLQHLYPYPVRSLFVVVINGIPVAVDVTEGEEEDTAELPVGASLGVGVEWSNGDLLLLRDPGPIYLNDVSLALTDSMVTFDTLGEAGVLRSGLDEVAVNGTPGELWEWVGYERSNKPLHLPTSSEAFGLVRPLRLTLT